MVDVLVTIYSSCNGCSGGVDEGVFVKLSLPAIPEIGSYLWLSGEQDESMALSATSKLEIAELFFPEWFNGDWTDKELTEEDLRFLDFSDATVVKTVLFKIDTNQIIIALDAIE